MCYIMENTLKYNIYNNKIDENFYAYWFDEYSKHR